jgi:hypothetical protein
MVNYLKHFMAAWEELEDRFQEGECKPLQENDVVCYLYHALLKRLEKEKIPPRKIKTEDTVRGIGRLDMNVGNRLLVEVRLLSRRSTYSSNRSWEKKKQELKELGSKLQGSKRRLNRANMRKPIVAVWNWKSGPEGIDDDLEYKLNLLKTELENEGIYLVYGPRKIKK